MKHLTYNVIKRLFDIICSLLAIVITSPLWLIIALGVKLSSEGPVFYRAQRVTKGRQVFTLYKFRSMYVYHPEEGSNKKSEGGYIANANRITKFGGFLRKSKLDELPQLLNILLSQMSIVGPRPLTKAGVEKHYIDEYACIINVKPGLTCLDSLFDYAHGELFVKSNEEYIEKVVPVRNRLARMYVNERSVGLDIYCILKTVQLIFEIAFLKKKDFSYTKYEKKAKATVSGERCV